jgi:prepilin-type N-terminal cleavage/methylation domain-containing protein
VFTLQCGRGRGPVLARPGFPGVAEHTVAVVAGLETSSDAPSVRTGSRGGSVAAIRRVPRARRAASRGGFTLVEVLAAIAILAVGVVALGASTGHAMTRIQASELQAERMLVVRQATDMLRRTEWSALESVCASGLPTFGSGEYSASCAVARPAENLKWVVIETTGPGLVSGQAVPSLMETTSISMVQPAGS